MSALSDFVSASEAVIEELSRETLPNDVILQKLLLLEVKISDAVAEATLKDDRPIQLPLVK